MGSTKYTGQTWHTGVINNPVLPTTQPPPGTEEQDTDVAETAALQHQINTLNTALGSLTTAFNTLSDRVDTIDAALASPDPTSVARRVVVLGTSHSDTTWTESQGVWWWQIAGDKAGLVHVGTTAIGGATTAQALEPGNQLDRALATDADHALVEFGGNDALYNTDTATFATNLTTIVTRLQGAGKRVTVVYPPPMFATVAAPEEAKARYAAQRANARQVANATGAYYLDPWQGMSTPDDLAFADPAYDSGDGMHLNALGQYRMGLALATGLARTAGVSEPLALDGAGMDWFQEGNQWVDGDGTVTASTSSVFDTVFRGAQTALISAGTTGETAVFAVTGATPGARVRIEYPYRIETATGDAHAVNINNIWPGNTRDVRPTRHRIPGMEGVHRYETTVPAEATEAFTAVLFAGPVTGGAQYQLRVGAVRITHLT